MKTPKLLKISCTQHERSGYGKDDITVRKYLETNVYYNEKGKAVKEEHFLPTGELETILVNEYDNKELLTTAKQFDEENILLHQVDFIYNDYQNIARQNHYFGNESTKHSIVFVYENGRLMREDIYEGDTLISTEKEYHYDDCENLIKSIEYDEDKNKKTVVINEYNEKNFVVKRVRDEVLEKDKRIYYFEYDDEGNKIKDLIYDYEDILISKTLYTYNEKKQLLEKEEEDLDRYLKTVNTFIEDQIVKSEVLGKEGELVSWMELTYDDDNLVVSQRYFARDETDSNEFRIIVEYGYEREY
ncbi:MAG: hypothetical protein LBV02_04870 [Bacteroidales bacterium]|jgi:hypothetical protein|nr:hypothetical protein [Bacteroidales bacterium]